MSHSQHLTSCTRSSQSEANIITGRTECFQPEASLNQICDLIIGDNTIDETKKFYNVWASNFEDDMKEANYKGPEILVQYLDTTIKLPKNAKILDVGCGTGLVGAQLQRNGYTTVDGLDMSEEMLALAVAKNCYNLTERRKVSPDQTADTVPAENLYDAMVLCSSFQPGHISPSCLGKLAAQLQGGGHIVWCSRDLPPAKKVGTAFAEPAFQNTLAELKKSCGLALICTRSEADFQTDTVAILGHIQKQSVR